MEKTKKSSVPLRPPRLFVGFCLTLFIAIFQLTDGYPMEPTTEDEILEMDGGIETSKLIDALNSNENIDYRREDVLKNLQKMFGVRGQTSGKSLDNKTPPQFMTELYRVIADPSGVTRGRNPFKIVRSFIERGTMLPQLFRFNISGLESNESVIEAELHLFRKRGSLKIIDAKMLRLPYYLIKVYQVLEGQSMEDPDVHRLLSVDYVGAHVSGWQVFNVKQAVLAWIAGAPNLGLLVTASTLFGDEASIEFFRRNDEHHRSKQPILVLFDDDGKGDVVTSDKTVGVPRYNAYNVDEEMDELVESETHDGRLNTEEKEGNVDPELLDSSGNVDRRKRQQDESAILEPKPTAVVDETKNRELTKEVSYGTHLGNAQEFYKRDKKIDRKQNTDIEQFLSIGPFHLEQDNYTVGKTPGGEGNDEKTASQTASLLRRIRSANSNYLSKSTNQLDDTSERFVQRMTKIPQMLSSVDIYERAVRRQQLENNSKKILRNNNNDNKRKVEEAKKKFPKKGKGHQRKQFPRSVEEKTTECARHELYIDFDDIGLSNFIIAPEGYSAFHCQGSCDGDPTIDREITNHATIQGIIYRMGLVKDFNMPCCVPTKLLSTAILFFDDYENVVLKVYEDMIADRCGCR